MFLWLKEIAANVRYWTGCVLVPEVKELNSILIDCERLTRALLNKERLVMELEVEKGQLQDQIRNSRIENVQLSAQYDVVKNMADNLYTDLKDSQKKFLDHLTGTGRAEQSNVSSPIVPSFVHPESIAQMIMQQADEAWEGADEFGPPGGR